MVGGILGAIAGDIIGSVFEHGGYKSLEFPLFSPRSWFTDDTVLTVAVADCLLYGGDFTETLHRYGRRYPSAGYGGRFMQWLASEKPTPYGSFGNGSGMRVSPVGFAAPSLEECLELAARSAEITHDHAEGIRGAQAIASAVWLAREGRDKDEIRRYASETFGYDLAFTIDERREGYAWDVTCQGSVPEAIVAFLDSADYEHAVRLAISLGGDSDTIACMAGGIAAAFYGEIPEEIELGAKLRLPDEFLRVIETFDARFPLS